MLQPVAEGGRAAPSEAPSDTPPSPPAEARERFAASEDGLAPLVLTLPEGRYLARLERRALGAGLPRRLETHDLGTLEVRGGERLERVVP